MLAHTSRLTPPHANVRGLVVCTGVKTLLHHLTQLPGGFINELALALHFYVCRRTLLYQFFFLLVELLLPGRLVPRAERCQRASPRVESREGVCWPDLHGRLPVVIIGVIPEGTRRVRPTTVWAPPLQLFTSAGRDQHGAIYGALLCLHVGCHTEHIIFWLMHSERQPTIQDRLCFIAKRYCLVV